MTDVPPPRAVLAALTPDRLAAAVAASRSWRQVLLQLGLHASRHTRALRALCDQEGIAYSHLEHHAPPDVLLREVLPVAGSWPEAMTGLGFAQDSGSARATIRKHARRLGVDVAHLDQPPPPSSARALGMTPDLRHLRGAGAYLVAGAFVLAGYRVSWPLEPAVYDLVVDTGERLLRVQVKTTSRRSGGSWACSITRSEYAAVAGGKRSVRYTPQEVDAFAVVDGQGDVYVIPIDDVAGLTNLSLRRYAGYRIPRLGQEEAACDESG